MRHIKLLLTAIAAIACISTINAQESRKAVLGIDEVSYSNYFTAVDVEMFRSKLVNAIQKTGRVTVVDYNATTRDAVEANFVLTASLDQLRITREMYEDKKTEKVNGKYKTFVKGIYPYLKATVSYTVKIIDCYTGAVQNQETYNISSGSFNSYSHKPDYYTHEAAHKGIMEKSVNPDDIAVLILNTFKVQGRVLQLEKGDAKKARTVYVSLGYDDGVEEKQILEVYKDIDIAGEISHKLIGEIEITEIMGPSRCLAKVRKGGEEILQALSNNENMPVLTRDVSARLFGGVR